MATSSLKNQRTAAAAPSSMASRCFAERDRCAPGGPPWDLARDEHRRALEAHARPCARVLEAHGVEAAAARVDRLLRERDILGR